VYKQTEWHDDRTRVRYQELYTDRNCVVLGSAYNQGLSITCLESAWQYVCEIFVNNPKTPHTGRFADIQVQESAVGVG